MYFVRGGGRTVKENCKSVQAQLAPSQPLGGLQVFFGKGVFTVEEVCPVAVVQLP